MRKNPFLLWVNSAAKNPTQNRFTRGFKMPGAALQGQFSEISDSFRTFMNDGLKTKYSQYFKPLDNPFYGGN